MCTEKKTKNYLWPLENDNYQALRRIAFERDSSIRAMLRAALADFVERFDPMNKQNQAVK